LLSNKTDIDGFIKERFQEKGGMKMKRLLALLLVVVMVISLVACGQSNGTSTSENNASSGTSSTNSTADAAKSSSDLTTVTVAMPSALEVLGYANWLCAIYNGYFEEEGLKVVMVPQAGTDVCKMLQSGEADFAAPAPALLFTASISGIDMKVVYQHDCNNIFGFAVMANSGINTWSDLNNKSIVTDSSWYYLCDPVLEAAGVDVDSIDFVSAADERSVLLSAGTVSAAFTWQKEWQLWQAEGMDIKYLNGEDVLKNTSNALVCLTSYYEDPQNAKIIQALGRGLAKGTYFCECNPDAAAAITVNRWPTLGITAAEAKPSIEALVTCATPDSHVYGESDMDRWKVTLDWLAKYNIVDSSKIDLNSLLKSSEFTEAYNNWDTTAFKNTAEKFDVSSVKNWTD